MTDVSDLCDSTESETGSNYDDSDPDNRNDCQNYTSCFCDHCNKTFPDYKTLSTHQRKILERLLSKQKRKANVDSNHSVKRKKSDSNETDDQGNIKKEIKSYSDYYPNSAATVKKDTKNPPYQHWNKLFVNRNHKIHYPEKRLYNNEPIRGKKEVDKSAENGTNAGRINISVNISNKAAEKEIVHMKKYTNGKGKTKHSSSDFEDSISSEMKILTDYLNRNPSKIKLLLQILNVNNNESRMKLYKCNQCNIHIIKKQEFQKHLQNHTDKKFKCDHCKLNFTLKSLKRHLSVHYKDGVTAKDFEVIDETKLFISENVVSREENNLSQNQSKRVENEVTNVFDNNSNLSEYRNDTEMSLKLSKRKNQAILYKCDVCDETFLEYATMMQHRVDNLHTPTTQVQCHHCGLKFGQFLTLAEHIRRHHDNLKLNMNDLTILACSDFKQTSLELNKDDIRSEDPAQSVKFLNLPDASNLVNESSKPRINLHVCTYCGLHYLERCNLMLHLHQEKNDLKAHIERSNKRGIQCTTCKLTFSSMTLQKHVERHHEQLKADRVEDYNIMSYPPNKKYVTRSPDKSQNTVNSKCTISSNLQHQETELRNNKTVNRNIGHSGKFINDENKTVDVIDSSNEKQNIKKDDLPGILRVKLNNGSFGNKGERLEIKDIVLPECRVSLCRVSFE